MRKALILGGGGFIGSRYYAEFASAYAEVVLVDRFYGASHSSLAEHARIKSLLRPQDSLFTADVVETRQWPGLFEGVTDVFLLNADTGTGNSFTQPSITIDENLRKLAVEIEAIRAHCDPARTKVIFTSSRAVYGEGHWICGDHGDQVLERSSAALAIHGFVPKCQVCGTALSLHGSRESDPHRPLSVYGMTKSAGEKLLELTLGTSGFDVRIVRYQNVYGIGQAIDNPYTGVLNWFSKNLIRGEQVKIFEQGHIVRDFIFVSDAVALLHSISTFERESGAAATSLVFNGGTGVPTRLHDAALLLREMYGSSSAIVCTDDYRPGDVLGAYADTRTAVATLGFEAKVDLREGLRRYAEWFSKNYSGSA